MKAVVYEGPRKVSVQDVPDARIEQPTDVSVPVEGVNEMTSRLSEGYEHLDNRDMGWIKVVLHPSDTRSGA